MMVSVVANGTANRAQIPGVDVAGKTGTAETADGQPPHAWFISFAPANDPEDRTGGDRGVRQRRRWRRPAATPPRRSQRA